MKPTPFASGCWHYCLAKTAGAGGAWLVTYWSSDDQEPLGAYHSEGSARAAIREAEGVTRLPAAQGHGHLTYFCFGDPGEEIDYDHGRRIDGSY